MFFLKKPTNKIIKEFLTSQLNSTLSYREVGATRNGAPKGFIVDHNRIKLGEGPNTFQLAKNAIRKWEMFNIGWVELLWPDTPIEVGATVAVLAKHFGSWSLNASRIVYLVDEDGPVNRFGFAYGTLQDHGESGEERFTVEWRLEDNSVWYDLFAFSRPNHFLSVAGFPVARILQKRFAKQSKQAMARAVNEAKSLS
jgi:uncharacterized protein (UPF0548 family)